MLFEFGKFSRNNEACIFLFDIVWFLFFNGMNGHKYFYFVVVATENEMYAENE